MAKNTAEELKQDENKKGSKNLNNQLDDAKRTSESVDTSSYTFRIVLNS